MEAAGATVLLEGIETKPKFYTRDEFAAAASLELMRHGYGEWLPQTVNVPPTFRWTTVLPYEWTLTCYRRDGRRRRYGPAERYRH